MCDLQDINIQTYDMYWLKHFITFSFGQEVTRKSNTFFCKIQTMTPKAIET